MSTRSVAIAMTCLAIFAPGQFKAAWAAEVHVCTGPQGEAVFADRPCSGSGASAGAVRQIDVPAASGWDPAAIAADGQPLLDAAERRRERRNSARSQTAGSGLQQAPIVIQQVDPEPSWAPPWTGYPGRPCCGERPMRPARPPPPVAPPPPLRPPGSGGGFWQYPSPPDDDRRFPRTPRAPMNLR